MSIESVCRICVENAKSYESLFDSNGQKSDVYLLVVKYFDDTIINFERGQHLKGVCVKCIQKIQVFDHFKKSVIRAQERLLEDHNEVKRENTSTGYDEELSLFHINDKSKHDLPVKENNLSNQCNNDAVCVRPEESEHIKVPKLEIVDALSGGETIQSNHEEFLGSTPNPYSLYMDRNQNIDHNESSSIEKSDETNPVNKVKNEIKSSENIDKSITKLLPNVEYACVRSEEIKHIEMPKLEIVDDFSGDESMQTSHEEFLESTLSAHSEYSGFRVSFLSGNSDQNIDHNHSSCIEKADKTTHVNKVKNKMGPKRSPKDIDDYIAKVLPSVDCGMCKDKQPTFTHLLQHFKSEHPAKECYAICCGKKIKKRFGLASHVKRMHSVTNAYPSENCIEKFDETNTVNKLKYRNRSPKDIDNNIAKFLPSVECGMCKEKQPTFTHLLQHFQSEHPAKKCYAICCGKMFQKRYMLARHVENSHSGPSVYSCKYCKKSFMLRKSLLLHMMAHKPRKPPRSPEDIDDYIAKLLPSVQCGICKEKLPTFTHLAQHFKSEHPEKECYAMCCGKKFRNRSTLANHARTLHSGRNYYTCKLCNKSFLLRKSLLLHMHAHKATKRKKARKRSPEDIDNFISKVLPSVECGMCKEKLPTFTQLALHFLSEHPEKECYAMCCGTMFKKRSYLADHVNSSHSALKMDAAIAQLRPSLECVLCKETCRTYSLVQYHFESKHPFDEFYIVCCNRKFKDRRKLLEHLQFHENPNAFKCDVCNIPFTQRQYLLRHMRTYHPSAKVEFPKHINDPIKTSDCNNDAACVRSEENKYIETPKSESVDVFSADESIQSYHEEFLDSSLSAHGVHSGSSVSDDDCNQNIDLNDCCSMEKADETIQIHKVKNKMAPKRSAEDIDNNIAKLLPSVECGMCKEKQATFTHLLQHFKSEHPAKKCYTMCCGKVFKKRSRLVRHVNSMHSGSNDYSCKLCNKSFLTHRGLLLHNTRVHKPNNLRPSSQRSPKDGDEYVAKFLPNVECGLCKEKQPTFTRLLQHFKSEHPTKECQTMCCGTVFKKRSRLVRHVTHVHSGPNALTCKLCNISFLLRKRLIKHMRAHNPNYPLTMDAAIAQLRPSLECVVCKETSTSYSLLQNHFKSKHPLEKFHIMCCNRKLKDHSEILEHMQLHESPNAFKCDVCNIPFTQRKSLIRHMGKYHPTSNVGVPKHINDPIKTSDCNNDATCVLPEERKHIEVPKLEIVDVFSGDESIQSYHEDFLDSKLSAHSVH